MHVLISTDTIGGVWTYAVELARAAKPLGVSFTFATMGAPLTRAQRQALRLLPNVDVRESSHRLEWMDDPWCDVRCAGDWMLSLEHTLRPDVVHLNGYAHGQWPFQSPRLIVAHSCVLTWWEAVKRAPAPSTWARYRSEVWAGLHAADTVVAPSRAMLAGLRRHYGPLHEARVIYNGRSASERHDPVAKEPFVFAAGRVWDEAKNIAALSRVAADLPWDVVVAGDDTHPDGRREPLPGVCGVGRIEPAEVERYLRQAAIYCLPAKYEPFGLSVLEAALAGCALVVGDIDSLREIWGPAAVYVPPDDPDALAAALRRLIDDAPFRQALADAARSRARRFAATAMAEAYVALYREMTRSRVCETPAATAVVERLPAAVRQVPTRLEASV